MQGLIGLLIIIAIIWFVKSKKSKGTASKPKATLSSEKEKSSLPLLPGENVLFSFSGFTEPIAPKYFQKQNGFVFTNRRLFINGRAIDMNDIENITFVTYTGHGNYDMAAIIFNALEYKIEAHGNRQMIGGNYKKMRELPYLKSYLIKSM